MMSWINSNTNIVTGRNSYNNGHHSYSNRRLTNTSSFNHFGNHVYHNRDSSNDLRNDFFLKIFTKLNEYRKESKFCDFEIRIPNKSYPVHKIILSSASPYFQAMFNNKENFVENSNNFVEVKDVESPDAIETILNFIYTGRVNITSHNVQEIAQIANMFEIIDLVNYCSKFLENSLEPSNCIGILRFADFYGFSNLCFEAKRFTERNFEEIIREDEYLELSPTLIRSFLKSEDLSIVSEFEVFKSTIRWILHDKERLQYLDEFVNILRLPLIPAYQLEEFIGTCSSSEVIKCLKHHIATEKLNGNLKIGYDLIRRQPRMCSRRSIFLIGGITNGSTRMNFCTLNSVQKLDMHTGIWNSTSPLCYPRSDHCVVYFKDQIYVIGGKYDSLPLDSVEIYDSVNDKWISGPNLKQPRSSFGACVHDSFIYVFGGTGSSGNTIERYDPYHQCWDFYDEMPFSLYGMQVIEYGGLIYIIGGFNSFGISKSVYSYNPNTRQMKALASLNIGRSMFACVALFDHFYAIGGVDSSGNNLSVIERYNINEDKWYYLAPMLCSLSNMCAISVNNLIYVFGGSIQVPNQMWKPHKKVLAFDPDKNQWYFGKSLPFCCMNASMILV